MKTITCIAIAVAILTACSAGETKFTSSEALTAESNFEKARKNAGDRYIRELGAALRVAMSKGDLVEANKIQSELKRINPSGHGIAKLPGNDEELRNYLKDTKWKFPDGKMVALERNGKVKKSFGRMTPKWTVKNMKLTFEEGAIFMFSDDYTSMKTTVDGSYYEGVAELIERE